MGTPVCASDCVCLWASLCIWGVDARGGVCVRVRVCMCVWLEWAWAPPLVPQLLCPALSASAFPSLDLNRAPLSSILITGDRIQDKLPQNMTHWHTEGLELKESEK